MIKITNGKYIVGFDDGYQLSKTANEVFENGVYSMGDVEPTIMENSLFYDNQYYKVGEGRTAITDDKLSDENARLLTMIGIAKELRAENVDSAEVILAVGLPFSNYGRDKQSLIDYYMRKPVLNFIYEGKSYNITIKRVIVCPQCYAAIASRLPNMKGDYIIIDIGSKTTDVVYVKSSLPQESKSITIEKAMIKWIKRIQSTVQIQFGKDLPEAEIMKVILNQDNRLPAKIINLINEELCEQVKELERELSERQYNLDYTNVIYVGGGAIVAKNYAPAYKRNVAYDTDVTANAKGYEFLANQIIRREVR